MTAIASPLRFFYLFYCFFSKEPHSQGNFTSAFTMSTPERNSRCPCGSGKKYKHCHGSAVRTSQEAIYVRLRRLDGEATDVISKRIMKDSPGDSISPAWKDYFQGDTAPPNEDDPETDPFFRWFLYNWTPPSGHKSADLIARGGDPRVNPELAQFIGAVLRSPYSFYQVTAARESDFDARDILRQTEITITDHSAARLLKPGFIIYARVVELEGIHFMMGCGADVLSIRSHPLVIHLRNELRTEDNISDGPIPDELLLENEEVLRLAYFDLLEEELDSAPVLTNTDGDPLLMHTIRYRVNSFDAAFAALRELEPDASDDDLTQNEGDPRRGKLPSATIHWSKRRKDSSKEDATIQAIFFLEGTTVTVETNSEKRAAKVRKEINARLGSQAQFLSSEVKSPEAMRAEQPKTKDPDQRAREVREQARLMASPEIQALLKGKMDEHWQTWPDIPLPALSGMTPRKAAKSNAGRELLESLLLDFESRNKMVKEEFNKVPVSKLRGELGM
jgi:hypothetical protein